MRYLNKNDDDDHDDSDDDHGRCQQLMDLQLLLVAN